MSERHLELYKKYRPKTWKGMIGQDKVVNSLKAAVESNKVPTAYAFVGPRGCGKTSAALILAKAVNCLDLKEGAPCNACEPCISIDNNTQVGVSYYSMANNGSVDDIRKITQDARLAAPIKRRVLILDEVHTISKVAFDALLIPLEDPTMPALFILCSTEVQKIPATILSRVQSRKFSLVSEKDMSRYLKAVIKKESIEVSDDELKSVIRQGRGSVRDNLTTLERIVETGEETEYANYGGRLLDSLSNQELGSALSIIAEASVIDSANGRDLAEQLFEDLRDLILAASGVDSSLYPNLPVDEPVVMAKRFFGVRGLGLIMDEVGDSLTRMNLGSDPRIHLEIAIVNSLQKLKALSARAAANKG